MSTPKQERQDRFALQARFEPGRAPQSACVVSLIPGEDQIPLSAVAALDALHDPRSCPFCWGVLKL
jgi:hypothetical protein